MKSMESKLVEEYKLSRIFQPFLEVVLSQDDVGTPDRTYLIMAGNSSRHFEVKESCYLAVVDRLLRQKGFAPSYEWHESLGNVLLVSVGTERASSKAGILMFYNGYEPGAGRIPPSEIFPKAGDRIKLAYYLE